MPVRHDAALLLCAALAVPGCRDSSSSTTADESIVCVDLHTGKVMTVGTAGSFPAVNPETGKTTLMPGMYCDRCATWHVAPPVEQLHRQKGVAYCPRTGAVLKVDGPRPPESERTP